MPPIKLIRTSQQTELTSAGQVRQMIRIDFTIGEDGPFNVSVPKESYTAELVHDQIMAFANQHLALASKFAP